jgi:hypothetical protein
MAVALGIHMRVGIEDNLWRQPGQRMTSVEQVEQVVRLANELGRKVATADEARQMLKIGTWYNSPDETLANLGLPAQPQGWSTGLYRERDRRTTPSAGRCLGFTPHRGAVRDQVTPIPRVTRVRVDVRQRLPWLSNRRRYRVGRPAMAVVAHWRSSSRR